MKNKPLNNVKLGVFVMAGLVFLIMTLYMIGKNKNLFGRTFVIKAIVSNVSGLMPGNNVRFKGIDVGTVKSISIQNDSIVYVTMTIDDKMKKFIRENAVASIGTDGLMGNRLININSQPGNAPFVTEGSVIQSLRPIETDEMLRTLNTTNNNMERITDNLRQITVKLNSSNSLWNLLSDTLITHDLKDAVRDFSYAGKNSNDLTRDAKSIVKRFEQGHGLASTIFTDSSLSVTVGQTLQSLARSSDSVELMVGNLQSVVRQMKSGKGSAGLVLSDTVLRRNLLESAKNLEEGTARFNTNMEALKSNFLFRRYFRKQEKKKQDKTR